MTGSGERVGERVTSTVEDVEVTSVERAVRARLGRWPFQPEVAHLVLLDHQMVPSRADVDGWIVQARTGGLSAIRTGALFPSSVGPFIDAGFETIDRLALLETRLETRPDRRAHAESSVTTGSRDQLTDRHNARVRTRPLRGRRLAEAATIDRRAFTAPWGNDRTALADILQATPASRARFVAVDRTLAAFAISGVANRVGYLQRLAVDPSTQRRGLGRALVADSLDWMHRRGATTAMVNTAFDNAAALSLYDTFGFQRRPDPLLILELRLDDPGR
jgi:[ribosomal protein S18]-alanine N-acetyltransferase